MPELKFTCENLVDAIAALPRNNTYNYINKATHTVIRIVDVEKPYGPITISRWNPSKGETETGAEKQTISKEMLFRLANAISEGLPINMDRVFGASYNTRSALETLLCHTPQFYYCYPGRIENKNGITQIKNGHKHIIWCPSDPHDPGALVEKKLQHMEINEIPTKNVIYNALELPAEYAKGTAKLDAKTQRMHSLMQMALYEIGKGFGFDTYIAANDAGIKYKGIPLHDHDHIVKDLMDEPTVAGFDGAANAGRLIDAMWFSNKSIPAVFEVEHSTGVTSGLNRMKGFMEHLPAYSNMRYIIVADEDLRDKVIQEINKPQFKDLHAYYLPYSTVSEMLGLVQTRELKGITESFIDTFIEDVFVDNSH
jgi:type II restriction enzyme